VATADAIGGTLVGNVSQPGKILAAGASALNFDFSDFSFSFDLSNAVSIGGIQAFIGTSDGSPNLPAIVGTPINLPSPINPGGLATILDQTGYAVDLSALDPAFAGITYEFPDVRFVAPGTGLVPTAATYEAVSIPVSLFGIDNTGNPGNEISAAPNPFQTNTSVAYTPEEPGSPTAAVANQTFLFDTGAQLSIISPAVAASLGLTDLDGNPIIMPFDTIDVQGAGMAIAGIPGYILDTLSVPRLDGGVVEFTDVPVYVLDVGPGIDGILGMNLFNGADSFMYDPYNPGGPQVSALFLNDRSVEVIGDEAAAFAFLNDPDLSLELQLLRDALTSRGVSYLIANPFLPGLQQVPEPSTLVLGIFALAALAICLRRQAGVKVRG
jgi:hypothetical protein